MNMENDIYLKTLHYKKYKAKIYYSVQDNIYYGKVTNINDLISFENSSILNIRKEFHSAVDDYIELCNQSMKEPEKPR